MNKTIKAIYEHGVFRPLEDIDLEENAEVIVTVEVMPHATSESKNNNDPLAGISFASGIGDLAQNFDDYRFGRK
jgi:predicted DNA-binding antitoxin AbrB/MazE fold protein